MTVVTNIEKIKKYIETDATTYALLLDGEWGSGKTYFLRNTLSEELSSSEFSMCYISLNGLSDLDELKKMVLFELMSDREKTVTKYANLTGRMLEVTSSLHVGLRVGSNIAKEFSSMEKAIERKKLENILFCFDDFERISDKLLVDEFLGFINSNFIEFDNIKVIIVANQSKLKKNHKDIFLENKEKIIGRTLKQEFPDLPEILDGFSTSFNQDSLIAKWLKPLEKRQEIASVLEDFKIFNLRQIRIVIGILNEILTELEEDLKEVDEEFISELISVMFNNLLVVYLDTDAGNQENFKDYKFVLDRSYQIAEAFGLMDETNESMKKFFEEYHEKNTYFNENIYYFDFITIYVLDARINSDDATIEIKAYVNKYLKEVDPIVNNYEKIKRFQHLDKEEFHKVIAELLEMLATENALTINQYLYLYYFLITIESKGIQLQDKWEDTVFNNYNRRISSMTIFSDDVPEGAYRKEIGGRFSEMRNLYFNAEKEYRKEELNRKVKEWFENGYSSEKEVEFEISDTLFSRANSLGVIDDYVMKSNKNLASFMFAVKRMYGEPSSNPHFNKQKDEIVKFCENISNSRVIDEDDPIQKYNINELVDFLKANIDNGSSE
ncbi:P-loop NTPase fold protein [Listeria seeligeri]|uniref:P-loop NTPase fold protein n=1 Tax=Listeria seeligeri TaxID=1640 RepID=UPI001A993D8C